MEIDNKKSAHSFFDKNYLKNTEHHELDTLLTEYPYWAHLHWLNGIKNEKKDSSVLSKTNLYAFYPAVLHQRLEEGVLISEEKQTVISPEKETENDIVEKLEIKKEEPIEETQRAEQKEEIAEERDIATESGIEEGKPTEETQTAEQKEEIAEQKDIETEPEIEEDKRVEETQQAEQEEEIREEKDIETESEVEEKEKPIEETQQAEPNEGEKETTSAIQPLYTEDYFAFTQTELPEEIEDDKPPTMEQVNSFTGWLKMMRNPAKAKQEENMELVATEEYLEDIEEGEAENTEVEGDKSLIHKQVVTESMAEIWSKYGDLEKAIDIYEKLILLNPEKKTYFAAKIKALKER